MKKVLLCFSVLLVLVCEAQNKCKCEFVTKYFSDTLQRSLPVNQLERCYINDTLFTTEWRLVAGKSNARVMHVDTFAIDAIGSWYHRFEGSFFETYSRTGFERGDSFDIHFYDTFYALKKRILVTARYFPWKKIEIDGKLYWLYRKKNYSDGIERENNIYVFFDFLYGEVIVRQFAEYLVAREPKFTGNCGGVYDAHNTGAAAH